MKKWRTSINKRIIFRSRSNNAQRPKSVQQWSVVDVQKWLRRHCGDYYHLYCEAFLEQDVTGTPELRICTYGKKKNLRKGIHKNRIDAL